MDYLLGNDLAIMEGMRGTLGILETRRSLRHTILLPGQQGTKSCFSAPQPPDRFCTQRSAHQAWGVSERPVLLGVRGPGPYLHGSGGSRAAGPDLEQAGAGGGRLPTLAGGAAPVDDHGFPAKQAHEVSGLLALDHTALKGRRESRSGKGGGSIVLCAHTGLSSGQLAWPRLTPKQAHHARVCVWSGAGQGTGGAGRLETALLAEVTPGTASAFPLPQGLAWLRLGLVQEPREPMFANIPLNGSPGMVRGHSSQIVTSASAKKAGGVVRKEPSKSGESPPAEPVQTAAEGLAVGEGQGGLRGSHLFLPCVPCHFGSQL